MELQLHIMQDNFPPLPSLPLDEVFSVVSRQVNFWCPEWLQNASPYACLGQDDSYLEIQPGQLKRRSQP